MRQLLITQGLFERCARRKFLIGLAIYDYLAGRRERHWADATAFAMLAPNVRRDGLAGGMRYTDAKTDDARLVLRVLDEAGKHGAVALNYAAVQSLLRGPHRVEGAVVRDGVAGATCPVRARLVINATGAWADALGPTPHAPKLRPLRGSHLLLRAWRLPLAQAITLMHPADGSPVFAYPWEGVTLVGTTDVDHRDGMVREPAITRPEFDYLMAALRLQFPQLGLLDTDVVAIFAGVRPVIDGGTHADPSKEGREHAIWSEDGLVTVTGGKLTTFRAIALDTSARRPAAAAHPPWPAVAPRRRRSARPHPRHLPAGAGLGRRTLARRRGGLPGIMRDTARRPRASRKR